MLCERRNIKSIFVYKCSISKVKLYELTFDNAFCPYTSCPFIVYMYLELYSVIHERYIILWCILRSNYIYRDYLLFPSQTQVFKYNFVFFYSYMIRFFLLGGGGRSYSSIMKINSGVYKHHQLGIMLCNNGSSILTTVCNLFSKTVSKFPFSHTFILKIGQTVSFTLQTCSSTYR